MISKFRHCEGFMTTWDQTQLYYRAWIPPVPTHKALILFHRGHEHSARFDEFVQELDLQDFAFFAWDARGNGNSPGPRDYADNFSVYVKDAHAFVNFISEKYQIPVENIVVLAHSVGGVIASTWVHDYAPPLRALILATPAFRIKLYIPFAISIIRWAQKINALKVVPSYVKAKVLTHDPEQVEKYDQDPKITKSISTNILLDVHDTSTRVVADAGAIRVPTLLLGAGSDWVVKLSTQKKFFERLSSSVKEMKIYPKFYHAVFHERERHLPIAKAREFILKVFQNQPDRSPLIDAHKGGYTKSEFNRLANANGSLSSGFQRLMLKTVGGLSQGVRLGWRTGFDSGITLDYVYANKAHGITTLGRFIDRCYLNSLGWKGIRQRKIHLEKLLRALILRTSIEGKPVRVLDIAAGPGRYILETMKEMSQIPISALLRDNTQLNLEAGRNLARELQVSNITFTKGDAFDQKSLASISPKPTIAIVSGLYELFPDNEPVLNSLRGLSGAVQEGGYLIYTDQPWHPQVEFIARVLTNREGNPWVMRRRTQEEMDELVRSVGFEKTDMEIDQWGIFSVSVARRIGV
jgi:alpha-beta hydrolase superfamily lysophospholipase/SAM-dependent methyltransferase